MPISSSLWSEYLSKHFIFEQCCLLMFGIFQFCLILYVPGLRVVTTCRSLST